MSTPLDPYRTPTAPPAAPPGPVAGAGPHGAPAPYPAGGTGGYGGWPAAPPSWTPAWTPQPAGVHPGWRVAALVMAPLLLLALVGAGVAVAVAASDVFAYDGERAGAASSVAGAATGDCLDDPWLSAPRTVPCEQDHRGEVFLVQELAGGAHPGEDELRTRVDGLCHDAFADYVGRAYLTSQFFFVYFSPTEQEWADGVRTATCVLETPGERGSVRGSGR